MSESLVKFDIDAGVARIVLNRPDKRNALTRGLIEQIARVVEKVRTDDSVRLLTLSAEGPVFCAGMDLGEMQQRAAHSDAGELWRQDTQVYRDLLVALFTLPLPTLASVQGPALAGGLGLVLACDLVLATERAVFSLPEPKRGITAAVVVPLLTYRIGAGKATYLLLSGNSVGADQAQRMGLCHEIVPEVRLADRLKEMTASILTGSPSALAMTKQHMIAIAGRSLINQLDAGMKVSAQARETSDAREGLAAFLEKRPPAWSSELGDLL